MGVFTRLAATAAVAVLMAAPALAQTPGGTTPPGTPGGVLQPSSPPTSQSTPATPNTGIGGSVSGGIPGTLGGSPTGATGPRR